MKPVVSCLFVVVGMLTAGEAFSQDFKNQAAAAAAQWDTAFNSGDASKVAQGYTKNAIILPAGGQQATGQQGAETIFGGFI
jgi:ketosteroid isomerase-like protein